MPLNSSGPISIGGATAGQSINLEFGRTATQQTSLSQLYRGGGIVGSGAPNVPTSGAISLSQFYGAANRITQTITISSNQTNYVANTAKVTGYQAGLMDVTFVIESGIIVSSNTTSGPAFDVDTSWASGDSITVVNNGVVVGRGGNGGAGGGSGQLGGPGPGSPGGAGGTAIRVQRAASVNNVGTLAGGGGGGNGGSGNGFVDAESGGTFGGGGGGGGRSSFSTNSLGGAGGAPSSGAPGQSGGNGTYNSAGSGGAGFPSEVYPTQNGVSGGDWGVGGSGRGAGGAAVSGNSNITWVATGTRLGAIT